MERTRFCTVRLELEKELLHAIDLPDVLFELGGLHDAVQETFWAIPYDSQMQVRTIVEIARGGYHTMDVSIPAVMSAVLLAGTDRFVVAHNHSTGDVTPSVPDTDLTGKLMAAANVLGLYFEDHLILGPNEEFLSFREQGLIRPAAKLAELAASTQRAIPRVAPRPAVSIRAGRATRRQH